MKKILPLLLLVALLVSGCRVKSDAVGSSTVSSQESQEAFTGSVSTGSTAPVETSDMFSSRDFEVGYDESESTVILLQGETTACDSGAVQISGSTVTITDEGTYILSGTLQDGTLVVDAEKTDKIQLVFNGVTMASADFAPVYIRQADKVFITLAAGTDNTLSNGGTFAAKDENNVDAVIFSKEDLTLNGSGTLTVTSPAGHGIVSRDSLRCTSGSYEITCASHALAGKDEICIANAVFTLAAGKDGLHAENAEDASLGWVYIQSGTFSISAEGDGISAAAYVQIEGGSFDITCGGGSANAAQHTSEGWGMMGGMRGGKGGGFTGGSSSGASGETEDSTSMKSIKGGTIEITESYEGLEGQYVEISGGDISLVASDDGLNASGGADASGVTGGRDGMFGGGMSASSGGKITISGGTVQITAYGDGIDANGSIEITGGYTIVCGPNQGDTSTLDYDTSAVISGGTFIGTGAAGMAQTFSSAQ